LAQAKGGGKPVAQIQHIHITNNSPKAKEETDFQRFLNHPLDTHGNTSLHIAVAHNDYPLVCLLLLRGADPNLVNDGNMSPYAVACTLELEKIVNIAKKHNGQDIATVMIPFHKIKELLHDNLDDSFIKTVEGNEGAASTRASMDSKSPRSKTRRGGGDHDGEEEVEVRVTFPTYQLHVHNGAYLGRLHTSEFMVNFTEFADARKATPLMKASYTGNLKDVQFLLSQGADVGMKDKMGCTALHWACLKGHLNVIEALIDVGAMLDELESRVSPLTMAVYGNQVQAVQYLITRGAKLTSPLKKKKLNPLCALCIWLGYWEIFKILVDSGAEIPQGDVEYLVISGIDFMKDFKRLLNYGDKSIRYQFLGNNKEIQQTECIQKAKRVIGIATSKPFGICEKVPPLNCIQATREAKRKRELPPVT
jgi:ankyrin repeat protein